MLFHPQHLLVAWSGIVGVAVGSFVNVLIYRLPHGYSIRRPSRSACPSCKSRIAWHDNIPLLSYVALRGRCRRCGKAVSPRYFLVEFLCGLLFIAVFLFYGLGFSTLYYWYFLASLLAITFIDLDHRIIPDALSFTGAAVGFAASPWIIELGWKSSLEGLVLGGGVFYGLAWGYERMTQREGLGLGDVKLLAMIGAFLGPKNTVLTIILSSFLGSVIGIVLAVLQKKNLRLAIPFGPFLAIGALACLFWGDLISFKLYSF